MSSFVLPPASHLTASPLGVQRRVQRAQAISGEAYGQETAFNRSSRANQQSQPHAHSAAHSAAFNAAAGSHTHSAAACAAQSVPSSSFSASVTVAPARPSMGLFAHAGQHTSSDAAYSAAAAALASEDRAPPLAVVAPPAELAKIYSFMDEAQSRTRELEARVETQKEQNRVLLIGASQSLIQLQTQVDDLTYENELMANELAALTAYNKTMLARARGELEADANAAAATAIPASAAAAAVPSPATVAPAPALRYSSSGSRDAVSSASHYTASPRFEGLTIASKGHTPMQQHRQLQAQQLQHQQQQHQ